MAVAFPSPGEHDLVGWRDFDILTPRYIPAGDVDAVDTPPGFGSNVALLPFQSTILAGSVKNGNIVSGVASTRTYRSM